MRFIVSTAAPADLNAACWRLAAHRPAPDRAQLALRYLDLFAAGEFDPAGLFVAKDDADAIRGALLVQAMPGALGMAWPPRVESDRNRLAIEDELVIAARDWLRSRGVKVCQAFAPESDRDDFAPLLRHDFHRITQVVDMRCDLAAARHGAATPLALVPFATDPGAFGDVLLHSYDGSLDCPELTGDRTPTEMVDGFRGNGLAGDAWWYTAMSDNRPIGVVMWEPAPEVGAMELSYLGLLPAVRGRGHGDALVEQSIRFARDRGFDSIALSVDIRNAPAIRLYERHGFGARTHRDVYLARTM